MNNLTDAEIDSGSHESIRQLRVFRRGGAKFAIPADDIATVAEWRRPTPLPQAPPAVRGVVSVQGRMLTVLDPVALLPESSVASEDAPFLVALRGDEQLGLVVDGQGETVSAAIEDQTNSANGTGLGVIKQQGDTIVVLDVKKLFPLAIRGRERRQRGF